MKHFQQIIDLSHPLESGMPTYPGDRPAPQIITRQESDYCISEIHIGTHYGTHLDAPRHFLSDGKTLDEFELARFTGSALCLWREYATMVALTMTNDELEVIARLKPRWLLIHTGFDRLWSQPQYFQSHPFLSIELARQLVELKIGGVGVDFPSVDAADAAAQNYPVHHLLMEQEILIAENLTNLQSLPQDLFTLWALPLKIQAEGAPARIVAFY